MSARILSIGLASPSSTIDQSDAARNTARLTRADDRATRSLEALYRRSGVKRRGAVVIDAQGTPWFFGSDADAPPSTGRRLELFRECAPPLAEASARQAIERAGLSSRDITHLVTVSCTGFAAPGVDHELVSRLPLSPAIERVNIGFMGCHAAINAIRVAAAFADADPAAVVLVCCVELCSLHFQHAPKRDGQSVANALFADGAGAAIIAARTSASLRDTTTEPPRIRATPSHLIPDSAHTMSWNIGDHGFEMSLSPRVPGLLETHVPPWIDAFLAEHALSRSDIGGWAIHPGGPRVVDTLRTALGLRPDQCTHSIATLAEHGNMSSPTILFILDRMARAGVPRPWVAIAFGPGLAGEAALIV